MKKKIKKAKSYLYSGVIAISIGSFFLITGIDLILNPEIPISCHGELSTSVSCKLYGVIAGGIAILVGIIYLILRHRLLKDTKH